MKQLILASTSVYRQELMKRLPLEFKAMAPLADEEAHKDPRMSPRQMAEHLAKVKAHSLRGPNKIVIGSDQLVHFEGQKLGKPGSREKAVEQLLSMAGKSHELITAVCVSTEDEDIIFTDVTRMHLRKLTRAEIERYIDQDQALDCAGAYKIEKAGISLMSKIETEDFTAIQGLPLLKLSEILRQKGFLIP